MTGWEIETILQFKRVENGHTAIEHDIDLFNEKSVYQRHHLNWDETIHELKEAQKQFNQKILSISVNDPSKNEAYRELMDVQIEHYKHHTHQIEGWL